MLIELLSLPERPLISIVGAGGKTTTMYTLAREIAERGQRVITTTTTNIFFPEKGQTDAFVVAENPSTLLRTVQSIPARYRRVTVVSRVRAGKAYAPTEAGKLAGLQPDQPYDLLAKTDAAAVIVEADGARGRLIKAPADHEPVIPPQSNVVLIVMSAGAIDQPLSEAIAHRPERIAALLGIAQGDLLAPERIARLVTSEQGGMKSIPEQARIHLLITHATGERQEAVQRLNTLLRSLSSLASVLYSAEAGSWCV
ncbi:MAG TPA: selenium cofactor biosynthesis protein YqeC [Ktedonobacteraceae bacterium]|nr:selenium cofactor biosynthesis protein YqeC [Ktedonobacteraceae bacterium]